jgi:C4-dicarboxylate-specific signal transduction histidine kinase
VSRFASCLHSKHRVPIGIEDECGGLPPGKAQEFFRPFDERSPSRKGLALGLSISRRAVGGEQRVRDIPGIGRVFTIDLPRL